jgi:Domain of unknown function (DUF4911)
MLNGIGRKISITGRIVINKQCTLLRLEIAPERIHFLKFILEGYDGLAVLSTVDAGKGIVELHYPPEIERDLEVLLDNIGPQIVKK